MSMRKAVGAAVIVATLLAGTSAAAGPQRKNTWRSDSNAMQCVAFSQAAYQAEAWFHYFWSIGDYSSSDIALAEWARLSYSAHNWCSR